MAIDRTANHGHQSPASDDAPRLTETEDMLRSLGLDYGSINVIKTITDEIIGEHVTPSMPWPEGFDSPIENKEDAR